MTGEIYPVLTKTITIFKIFNFPTIFFHRNLHLELLHRLSISKWHFSSKYENNTQIPRKKNYLPHGRALAVRGCVSPHSQRTSMRRVFFFLCICLLLSYKDKKCHFEVFNRCKHSKCKFLWKEIVGKLNTLKIITILVRTG